ncbi:MAG: hypothetical protein Q7T74_05680, partial [Candidatus Saccharibacteria bacterium]|nr:hypothetical protein [Candidatus Saccharibacteria bacterium]
MNRPLLIHKLDGRKESAMALALNILVVIAVLYTLYFCRTLFLPVFVAGFIALFSSPLVRFIAGFKVPHALAAALVVILLVVGLSDAFVILVEPAGHWF